jgi:hypothetical protein
MIFPGDHVEVPPGTARDFDSLKVDYVIRIDEPDIVAGRSFKARVPGGARTAVGSLDDGRLASWSFGEVPQDRRCSVGRTIVDEDQLDIVLRG